MPGPPDRDVTRLLREASEGDEAALSRLFEVLYREIRRLAAAAMRSERGDHTLQPTALVHEAYLRLAHGQLSVASRPQFFGVAAIAMRRILVEHARARKAHKRGGVAPRVSIDDVDAPAAAGADPVDLELLDQALSRLSAIDDRQARIVELRYFAGLSVEETAAVVHVSARTVKREWQMARAWLRREMAAESV